MSLTMKLDPLQEKALSASARQAGYGDKVQLYANLLFEAAFAARIGQERSAAPLDRELDEQVKLVFCMAGTAPVAAIATALGVPGERVARILDGWKEVLQASVREPVQRALAARPLIGIFIFLAGQIRAGSPDGVKVPYPLLCDAGKTNAVYVSAALKAFVRAGLVRIRKEKNSNVFQLLPKGAALHDELSEEGQS